MDQAESRDPMIALSSEPPGHAQFDLRVLQSLRRIIRAIDLHSRRLVAQHNVTGPQLVCLLSVKEQAPLTPSAIARHVHLSPSTVIGILDRLEGKGLVRRERDRQDRRRVLVSLTEVGEAVVVSAPSPLQGTLARAMERLPEAEQATLAGSLERIVELMEVRDVDAAPILETGPIPSPTSDSALDPRPSGKGEH
jgi:DNA-binding MarR family transcriptional regulator